MIQLQLSPTQAEALRQTLTQVLADLSYEIANTDKKSYRDVLKAQRDDLRLVLTQLSPDGSAGAEAH